MSSHHDRVRYDATQGDLVPCSPTVVKAEKILTPEQLDKIFDMLAVIEFLTLCSFFCFCFRDLSGSAWVGASVVFTLIEVATFGVYCVLKPHFDPTPKQPSSQNHNIYEDVPLSPLGVIDNKPPDDQNLDLDHGFPLPPSASQQSSDVAEAVDTDRFKSGISLKNDRSYHDKAQGKMVPIQKHKHHDKAQKKILYISNGGADLSGEHHIWAQRETRVSLQENVTQSPRAVHRVLPIRSKTGPEGCFASQQVALSEAQAKASLEALLDQVEKSAVRDGPIAAEYRYRKQLKALFKAALHTTTIHTSLRVSFLARVKKYAMDHTINQIGSLYARSIVLAHDDDVNRAEAFWRFLERYEEKKKRDAANTQWSEQVESRYAHEREEKERAKKEKFLQEVRQYAVDVGVKAAKKTFSNNPDTCTYLSADIVPILQEVRAQEIEKERQREAHEQARLDAISDIARTCGIEGAKDQFDEELRRLIPARQIPKFWKKLHEERLQRNAVWLKKHPQEKTAFFTALGIEAVKEALFRNTIDERVYCRSKKGGGRTAVIHSKDTYAHYKDFLSVLAGQENVRQKFLQIYDDELKRHGQYWRRLASVKKEIEDCGSVFYIRDWYGVWIDQLCSSLGFSPVDFWDHVYGEEGLRNREKAAEEQAAQAAAEAAQQEEVEAANEVRRRRVHEALAIGEGSRQCRSGLFQGLASVQGKFVELGELLENLQREQERQADEAAAQEALLHLAINTPLAGRHRLIEPTTPTAIYTPKAWDANAGGFTQYWQLQAANCPLFQPIPYNRGSGSRFNMRYANDERWPEFQEHTIYSFYGYMLRYRMVMKDLSSLQRSKQAEDGSRWPTQWNLEPLWAKWKPAGEFKLPVNRRFQTTFRGMFWRPTEFENLRREKQRQFDEALAQEALLHVGG
ncbi:uncharacterized protein N0V89_007576 [Didymosphaeria variabile]|uniref:Uncharacterized protein n=1 Tax=Didymosphaeria variabile TaxID=1932322 RepID=A0A9W8XJN1_9PLEO|nr:uncharacterized protein N0V89_007576 [Didymosphaeria variabile]KAJ4352229.1 hypothetical protein N0V89_007576 [Didymosphaeria variabile]